MFRGCKTPKEEAAEEHFDWLVLGIPTREAVEVEARKSFSAVSTRTELGGAILMVEATRSKGFPKYTFVFRREVNEWIFAMQFVLGMDGILGSVKPVRDGDAVVFSIGARAIGTLQLPENPSSAEDDD